MALPEKRTHSIKEIYGLPDGQRAELIDGDFYMMAPPSRKHQMIVGELFGIIYAYLKAKNGFCTPYVAPFAVFLNKDDRNYVEPDICVICDRSKLTDAGCSGAPDWIIEVVSPGSRRMDYMIKLFKYRSAGVREYWIVDPAKDTVLVYDFQQNDMAFHSFSDTVTSRIYEDLSISFGEFDV